MLTEKEIKIEALNKEIEILETTKIGLKHLQMLNTERKQIIEIEITNLLKIKNDLLFN